MGDRRKSGARREPVFDITPASAPQAKPETDEAAGDRAARPRARGAAGKSRRKRGRRGRRKRSGLGRLVYWTAVAALWLIIAGIGGVIWVGLHLPPIQSLEIP